MGLLLFQAPAPLSVTGKEAATRTDGDGSFQIQIPAAPLWLQDGESCHRTCDSGSLCKGDNTHLTQKGFVV